MWKIRPPKLRLAKIPRPRIRLRACLSVLPILTGAEKSALGILLVLLSTGAGLRACERSGIVMGPVSDWESLRRLVIRARADGGPGAFPCADASRAFAADRNDGGAEIPAEGFTRTGSKEEAFTGGKSAGNGGGKKTGPAHPVNLNTATEAQLHSLPGVGPATAKTILAWRAAHGKFATPEELLNVKGIGPKKFEALRKFVRVPGEAGKDSGGQTAAP